MSDSKARKREIEEQLASLEEQESRDRVNGGMFQSLFGTRKWNKNRNKR